MGLNIMDDNDLQLEFDKLSLAIYHVIIFKGVLRKNKNAMNAIKTLNKEVFKDNSFKQIWEKYYGRTWEIT